MKINWNPFRTIFLKKFLGIDVGTSLIKAVEISRFGQRRKLENYGAISASALYKKPFRTFEKNSLVLSGNEVAKAVTAILKEANIKTRQAIFSIPDFSTFFTNFDLPPMTKEELPQAIKYEARQYIPLPLGEVTLDWQVIDGKATDKKSKNLKILLVAVPNNIINQYKEIARLAQLELVAIEAEAFSLVRALVREGEKKLSALIDIGAQSTTCNIVEKGILKSSYSFDMSGNDLTEVLSKGMGVGRQEAEALKVKYGILSSGQDQAGEDVKKTILPFIDIIIKETENILNTFYKKERKEVESILLTGGTALMPGLKTYFASNIKREVEVPNPFSNIFYPPILEENLKEMGPAYAVALGAALRGLEY